MMKFFFHLLGDIIILICVLLALAYIIPRVL